MLKFELTLDETNMILTALSKAPYEQVAGLIDKIRDQAQPQLNQAPTQPTESSDAAVEKAAAV